MQIIQLQVQDKNVELLLTLFNSLKNGIIENITINQSKNYINSSQFQKDKLNFQTVLDDYKKDGANGFIPFNSGFDKIRKRLISKYGDN